MARRIRRRRVFRRPRRMRRSFRRHSRKGFRGNKRTAIVRAPKGGLPDSLYMRHIYTARISVALAGTASNDTNLSGNDLVDPEITGGGGKPRYYDQLAALYDRFTVMGSRIKVVHASPSSTFASGTVIMVVRPVSNDGYVQYNALQNMELPNSRYKIISSFSGGPSQRTITHYAKTKTVMGVKDVVDNVDLSGTAQPAGGSSPLSEWRWNISMGTFDGTTQTVTYTILVTIIYYVKWSEKVDIAVSS